LCTTLFYRRQFKELGYSLESPQKWAGVLVKAGRSQVYYGLLNKLRNAVKPVL
jgi:hypothetical protein